MIRRASHPYKEPAPRTRGGFSLVEVLLSLAVGSMLIIGLAGVSSLALGAVETVSEQERLTREASFALDQMVWMVSRSPSLLLPLHDEPDSDWPENIREQTEPASPPIGSSTKATAVLAVLVPISQDLDGDGFSDADEDRDGLVDEDTGGDRQLDFASGIHGVDDDGDGEVDEGSAFAWYSDDESSTNDDDPINGLDDDDDANLDEDPPEDMNADGCPGICGVDDDRDGQVDEGSNRDDDEDGASNEEWINPVVFFMKQGKLWQRTPVPWDPDGLGNINGRNSVEQVIADHVTRFRVERLPIPDDDPQAVDLTLELMGPQSGERVSLQVRVTVGEAL